MIDEHFLKLEQMYLRANINTQLFSSTTCKIAEGHAEISLQVADQYHHALGAMHGAVYFKLLDDAAYFAVNSVVRDVYVLTTEFKLHFLRPVVEGQIKAVGELRFQSRNLWVAAARLFNEQGKEVAFGTGSFARSKMALDPEIGYRL